jgi:hypothetical protein
VNLEQAGSDTKIEEVAADKGYHAANTLELSEFVGLRTQPVTARRVGKGLIGGQSSLRRPTL